MNQVHKAQWKGYPQLSYTLKYKDDPDKYKISLSFKPFDTANFTILVVTVSKIDNLCKPNMEQRINENPILAEKMEKIKQRLKK